MFSSFLMARWASRELPGLPPQIPQAGSQRPLPRVRGQG
ncbi:MAG: hypothetical protein JWN00_3784, partial [Actinomycetia bacterium]|nr:hypothetical protein [Actinomycetes bacterium]